MRERTTDSISVWTDYWQFNAHVGGSVRPELDQQLEPIWHEITDLMPNGARILDLATGNGPVALSCAERARLRRNHLKIDAVDAAGIMPPDQAPDPEGYLPIVRFHDGVWLEQLPFGNGQFNGVVSQYGFEYAEEERSVSETSRILSPGGRIRFVMHARKGAVWRDIRSRNSRLEAVLGEDGVLSLILQLVRAQQQKNVALFNERLQLLSDAANTARELAEDTPTDDTATFYSREFLYVWMHRKKYKIDQLVKSLEDGWKQASGTAIRYAQMLRVAKTADDVGRLLERFKSAGLNVNSVRLNCNPGSAAQIGWQLDLSKPGPSPS